MNIWRLVGAACVSVALIGCGSGPTRYRITTNHYCSSAHKTIIEMADPKLSYLAIENGGNDYHPRTVDVNNQRLLTSNDSGWVVLPVAPGEYIVDYQTLKVGSRPTRFTPIVVDIPAPGYVARLPSDSSVWNPYKPVALSTTSALEILTRKPCYQPANDYNAYLPADKQQLVTRCTKGREQSDCQDMLNGVPEVVLTDSTLAIATEVDQQYQILRVGQQYRDKLPPEVLYDKTILGLRAALTVKAYEKALPLFDDLKALGAPREADLNYYHGEALVNTGRYSEGLTVLGTYLRELGRESRFYNDALLLLNEAQENLE